MLNLLKKIEFKNEKISCLFFLNLQMIVLEKANSFFLKMLFAGGEKNNGKQK